MVFVNKGMSALAAQILASAVSFLADEVVSMIDDERSQDTAAPNAMSAVFSLGLGLWSIL